MNYRSLLVYLDNSPACEIRTRLAMRLARERDYHLVGLAPTGLIEPLPTHEAEAMLAKAAGLAWDKLRDQAEQATQAFHDRCQAAGVKSFEVVLDENVQSASILEHADCSDLTLVSQAVPGDPGFRREQEMVEEVVLYSPRPTLIVPHAGHFEHLGRRVLIAWDNSREAARAVADALPLLVQAEHVEVVQWNEPGQAVSAKTQPRLEAFRRWLMWHGVAAGVHVETTNSDITHASRSRATHGRADLLVMGAYGHTRWAERVMGGATRGLLAAMTVPVLMSH